MPAFAQNGTSKPALQDIDYTALIEQKMKLEDKLEHYVNGILDEMLGPNKASVKIDITPNAEKSRVTTESWAKQNSEKAGAQVKNPKASEFLPGIPMKQQMVQKNSDKTGAGALSGQKRNVESVVKVPESFIKKMNATLIISDEYPDETYTSVENLITHTLNMDPAVRGDKLTVEKVHFSPFRKLFQYLTNPFFYLALLAAALSLIFFRFLFSLLKTLKDMKEMKSEVEASGEGVGGGGGGGGVGAVEGELGEGGSLKGAEGEDEPGEEGAEDRDLKLRQMIESLPVPSEEVGKMAFKPFKFVENKDLKKIAYLLANESPEVAATVIHYLDDEKAARLLKLLPDDKKADVTMAITHVQFVEQAKVSALERIIKRKIDLTSGGVDRLMNILGLMDDESKKQILDYVSSTNPDIADKVKSMIFSFENLSNLDDRTLQTILAEINAPDLAVALKGMDEEFNGRIMSNLSEAASKLVQEEQESGRAATATEAQIASQRRAVIAKVREMEAEGKIDLGGAKEISILPEEMSGVSAKSIMEEVDEEIEKDKHREDEKTKRREKLGIAEEPAPVMDNEKAFEHYSRGGDYFQEGNYEEALAEFEESVKYNPEIWQSYQYMGSALYALGREPEAIRAYEKSLELNPDNEDLKAWLDEHRKEPAQGTGEAAGEAPGSEAEDSAAEGTAPAEPAAEKTAVKGKKEEGKAQ